MESVTFFGRFLLCLLLMPKMAASQPYQESALFKESYALPELPYAYNALEPHMDVATVTVHHSGHHAAYTTKMNAALKEWRSEDHVDKLANTSILNILQNLNAVPEKYRTRLRNNGGGYFNHAIYWACMGPGPSLGISGTLEKDVIDTFGSFANFKEQFTQKAMTLFGSGYAWLSRDHSGALVISTTANQDSPVTKNLRPILVIDVWEHAYYLNYQNRRAEFITAWWNLVNWAGVDTLDKWWKEDL